MGGMSMATSKPQLNVYVSQEMRKAIQDYSERYGVPQGKLIEQAWNFFTVTDIAALRARIAKRLSDGIKDQDLQEWYLLLNVLQAAVKGKMGR